MLHVRRVWSVTDETDPDELARKLTATTWCACNGFRLAGVLFLNDATGPDGAQEYAVVDAATLRQVESITFGWLDQPRAADYIRRAIAGELGPPWSSLGIAPDRIQTPAQHGTCGHCA